MGWSSNPEQDKANSRKIAEGIIDDYPGPPYLLLGWIDLVNGDIESVKQNASLALEVAPKNNTVLPVAASLLRRVGIIMRLLAQRLKRQLEQIQIQCSGFGLNMQAL